MRTTKTPLSSIIAIALAWLAIAACNLANAQVLYIGAFNEDDYVGHLIRSALFHTEDKYGILPLHTRPPASGSREASMIRSQPDDKRIALTAGISEVVDDPDLIVLPVPVMRGVVGYRICFSSPKIAEELNSIATLDDLKKYTFGVGSDWYDRQILDTNDLKNIGVGYNFLFDEQINSLFNMTIVGRVDILCRGINEAFGETTRYPVVQKTILNESFALHYDIPFFIYMHKNNQKLKERLAVGFDIINKNGNFQRYWDREFKKSVDFANMKKRKIISLNGGDQAVPKEDYERFLYKP